MDDSATAQKSLGEEMVAFIATGMRRGLEGSWNFGLALQGSEIPNGHHTISAPVQEACLDLELSKFWLLGSVSAPDSSSFRGKLSDRRWLKQTKSFQIQTTHAAIRSVRTCLLRWAQIDLKVPYELHCRSFFSIYHKYQTYIEGPVNSKLFFLSGVSSFWATITSFPVSMRWNQPHQASNMFRHAWSQD